MSKNIFSRRSVLGGIGAIGVGVLSGPTSAESKPFVSKGAARQAAKAHVQKVVSRPEWNFSEWENATVGKGTQFEARNAGNGPKYVPSAYLFEVNTPVSHEGYVTASARADWPPILEYSKAKAPSKNISKVKSGVKRRGHSPTGRKLYQGGTKYYLELTNGARVGLRKGRVEKDNPNFDPNELSFIPGQASGQAKGLETFGGSE